MSLPQAKREFRIEAKMVPWHKEGYFSSLREYASDPSVGAHWGLGYKYMESLFLLSRMRMFPAVLADSCGASTAAAE